MTMASVWDQVPEVHCQGLCAESCGPIEAGPAERRLLKERGAHLPPLAEAVAAYLLDGDYTCPLLKDNRCTVYDVRPTICRMWGAVEGMPCQWGCVPDGGRLPDILAQALLERSMEER